MHIITHIAKRILKYLPLECIAVELRLFCHFIINLLINLFSPEIYSKLISHRYQLFPPGKKSFFIL